MSGSRQAADDADDADDMGLPSVNDNFGLLGKIKLIAKLASKGSTGNQRRVGEEGRIVFHKASNVRRSGSSIALSNLSYFPTSTTILLRILPRRLRFFFLSLRCLPDGSVGLYY